MDVVYSVHFMVNWENMFSLLCQQLLINVVVVGRMKYKALVNQFINMSCNFPK